MDQDYGKILSRIEKKLDKLLNLNTKIAKVLHLLPVSEKEERDLQILQRTNLNQAAKVNDELDNMQNKNKDNSVESVFDLFKSDEEVFGDVIDTDFIVGGDNNG